MIFLITGLFLFFSIHVLPSLPLRQTLIAKLGEGPYKGLYSLIALSGLVLIVYGKANAEFVEVWSPPVWTRTLTMVLMPLALFFLAIPDIPNNFRRRVAHPMMTGVLVWSVAHLIANGDLAAILMFGCFSLYSVFSIISVSKRKPFVKKEAVPIYRDFIVLAFVAVSYAVIFNFHRFLSGVSLV